MRLTNRHGLCWRGKYNLVSHITVAIVYLMPLILFNKPFQVMCQFSAHATRPTLADHLTIPGIYPAGRLDADSEGLVLLTDDGRLQHDISHPVQKLAKT